MPYCDRRTRLEYDCQCGFEQVELKACCRRTVRMRDGKPLRPSMIDCCPEFSRSIPRGSLLLIDAVLEKIVRAGLIGSMVEADEPLRLFFFGVMGECHYKSPILTVAGPTVLSHCICLSGSLLGVCCSFPLHPNVLDLHLRLQTASGIPLHLGPFSRACSLEYLPFPFPVPESKAVRRLAFSLVAAFVSATAGCGTCANLTAPPPERAPSLSIGITDCRTFGGVGRSLFGGVVCTAFGPLSHSDEIGRGGLVKGAGTTLGGIYLLVIDTPLSLVGDIVTYPIARARRDQEPWALSWGDLGSDDPLAWRRAVDGVTTPPEAERSLHSPPLPPGLSPPTPETPHSAPPPAPRPHSAPPTASLAPPTDAMPP